MELTFGKRIPGLKVGDRKLRAAVFNENEVRAAAGITLVLGAAAFCLASAGRSPRRSARFA